MHDRYCIIAVAYNVTYCYIMDTPDDAATSTGANHNRNERGFDYD